LGIFITRVRRIGIYMCVLFRNEIQEMKEVNHVMYVPCAVYFRLSTPFPGKIDWLIDV